MIIVSVLVNKNLFWKIASEASPSFKIAMIRTMNGEKSNFHIKAMNMKPNYNMGINRKTR